MRRKYLAQIRGASDPSGIVLEDFGDESATLRKAAELLSFVHAEPVSPTQVALIPYLAPEPEELLFGAGKSGAHDAPISPL